MPDDLMEHIEFEKLLDIFEGGETEPLPEAIASHLNDCTKCSVEFRRLAEFIDYVAPRVREDVPQAATARILNIYHRRPVLDEPHVTNASGLGFLIFDDWAMALNERYSGLDSRQMLFRVDEHEIDLRLEFTGNKCRLSGQILPGVEDATISLSSAGSSFSTPVSNMGEFEFDLVEPGTYRLRISYGVDSIVLEEVPLHQ